MNGSVVLVALLLSMLDMGVGSNDGVSGLGEVDEAEVEGTEGVEVLEEGTEYGANPLLLLFLGPPFVFVALAIVGTGLIRVPRFAGMIPCIFRSCLRRPDRSLKALSH